MNWEALYHEDPPARHATSDPLRVLWRVERRNKFRVQIITAAIYRHPAGQELRVFIEPEEKNDLLWSSAECIDFGPLEERATSLRDVLIEKGWMEIPST